MKLKYVIVLLFLASLSVVYSDRCTEIINANLQKIGDLKNRIVGLGSAISEQELSIITNEIRALEKENMMCQRTVRGDPLAYTGPGLGMTFPMTLWWGFVEAVWWVFGFNGILSLLVMAKGNAMQTFNEIADKTTNIYKRIMSTVLYPAAENEKSRSPWMTVLRYISVVAGVVWSAMYPVLLISITFLHSLRRTLVPFLATLGFLALVRLIIPYHASLSLFWYLWRSMEAISFFTIALMVSRPPRETTAKAM